MKKKMIAITLALMLAIGIAVPAFSASVTDFTDVPTNAWYYAAVDYATSNGLFNGTSATTFSPDAPMTRGMFVTVLGRMADVPDTYGRTQSTPFNDVTQADYFFPYAVWASDNGIVTGVGNNAFNPHGEITREQIATILYRYAEKSGNDITYSGEKYAAFADTASVSSYAVIAMQWATTHGIINGANGNLNPQDKASRAQVAQIFMNFSQLEAVDPSEPDNPGADETVDWENYNPTYDIPSGKSAEDADGGYYDYDLANEVMAQVNALRAEYSLDALLYHPCIQEWAGIRAVEQIAREGHTRPDGSVYSSVGVGLSFENITIMRNVTEAEMGNISELAARAVNNWFTSTAGHKEAMLSYAPNLGSISCYVRGNTIYVVELFSNRTLYYMDYLIQ